MMRASLHQVATWLKQSGPFPDVTIEGVSTDTRTLVPGNLFVALKGERFDGHDHLAAALAAGAVAAVVSRANTQINLPQILVDDTLAALQTLGKCWREQVDPFVIGITGSAGKTTVKQLLASIFAEAGVTRATAGNLNNDIGVPLTLLSLEQGDQFAVIEMGANHVGEIARLTALAQPDIGLVTMAGSAHIGEFGSAEAIVQGKGELFTGLTAEAKAVINLDSYGADQWWAHCAANCYGFSLAQDDRGDDRAYWQGHYDKTAERLSVLEKGAPLFDALPLPLPGQHNATNLLAAIAVARAAGISPELIVRGMDQFVPATGRMSLLRCSDQLTVIDDSYNANPESMRAALDYLASRPGRRIAILGDMGELGPQTDELHRALIRYALSLPLHGLLTLGDAMKRAMNQAMNQAMNSVTATVEIRPLPPTLMAADEPETLAMKLLPALEQDNPSALEPVHTTVLLKGSRFMRMERMMKWLSPAHSETGAN